MNYEFARAAMTIAMRTEGEAGARKRIGHEIWRALAIEKARAEMIAELSAEGLRLIQCSAARADDPMRRLRFHRGKWQMRITITRDPRQVGKMEIFPLDTADIKEAQIRRDFMEKALLRVGLLSDRATVGIK